MSPLNIILADDHAAVRKGLHLLLEVERNVRIIAEATDGMETIRAVQALHPDLLLLDIEMPRMNGLEVLQYLRNSGHTMGVIVLSHHCESLYVAAAMRLGADEFVAKSAEPEALIAAIQRVRHKGAQRDASTSSLPDGAERGSAKVSSQAIA